MIINELVLDNIRSYQKATIEFPKGAFLLSGDVGAGKTTILLAIEFALFGLMRGSLSGSELLRHGTNEGGVKLSFEINEEKITNYKIFRKLKRTSTGISQDAGYLEINGERQDLTHTELKSKILEILGYPKSLLSKNKGLIFRYTTYTPQEEVKKIMYESPEERLDTLRKVFGLDRYKNSRENSLLLAKDIKQTEQILHTKVENEEEVNREVKKLLTDIETHDANLGERNIILENQAKEHEQLRNELKSLEERRELIRKTKQESEIIKERLNQQKEKIANLKVQQSQINILESCELIDISTILNEEKILQNKLLETKEKKDMVKEKISVTNAKIQTYKENFSIENITICPTCKQEVTIEYKKLVIQKNKDKILEEEEKLNNFANYLNKANNNLEVIENKLAQIREKIRDSSANNERHKQNEEKKLWKKKLEEDIIIAKNNILSYQEELEKKVVEEFDEEKFLKKKKLSDLLFDEINENKIAISALSNEIKHKTKILKEHQDNLKKIHEIKKEIKKLSIRRKWLLEYFINSINSIEKNVLLKIHTEFNASFQDWFETLISDDTITARLDETFTPYIIQNGQKTSFENLSGGEKTSMALSYRLALNRVISDFMSRIKTNELLILDEPTDGFSANQLDKIRDVLDKVPAKQIVIVSHEPKLESFVEEIIRINKTGHNTVVS